MQPGTEYARRCHNSQCLFAESCFSNIVGTPRSESGRAHDRACSERETGRVLLHPTSSPSPTNSPPRTSWSCRTDRSASGFSKTMGPLEAQNKDVVSRMQGLTNPLFAYLVDPIPPVIPLWPAEIHTISTSLCAEEVKDQKRWNPSAHQDTASSEAVGLPRVRSVHVVEDTADRRRRALWSLHFLFRLMRILCDASLRSNMLPPHLP